MTVIFTEQNNIPNMTEKLWMPQRPDKLFEGRYMNITHVFKFPNASNQFVGEPPKIPNITITYMCFIAKVPNYQKVMKTDGIIGLAPVISDMSDYSFIYQIMK